MPESIKVLLVDDHAVTRLGTAALLQSAEGIELSAEARDGQEAIRAAEDSQPDVVLMDLVMPRVDGVAATREILARRPKTRILVMTGSGVDDQVEAAVRAGAMGYVSKSAPVEEILDAIRCVHGGEHRLPASLLRRLIEPPPLDVTLSERQLEILHYLGTGLDSHQTARRSGISEASIRSHISRIFRKLGLDGRAHLVRAARRALRGEASELPAGVAQRLREAGPEARSTESRSVSGESSECR
jgi:DNA-binding NarL/FixJ family response regulator